MTTLLLRLMAVCLLAVTTACVPILAYDEYLPKMAGGTVRTSNCMDTKSVRYETNGIALTASVYKPWRGQPTFSVGFSVAAGITVGLQQHMVQIASPANAPARQVAIRAIQHRDHFTAPIQSMLPSSAMVGDNVLQGTRAYPRNFWLTVPLDEGESAESHITLPLLSINGNTVSIPPVTFRRHTRIHVMVPLNC